MKTNILQMAHLIFSLLLMGVFIPIHALSYFDKTELVLDNSGIVMIDNKIGIGTRNINLDLTINADIYVSGNVVYRDELQFFNTAAIDWNTGQHQLVTLSQTSPVTFIFTDPPEGTRCILSFAVNSFGVPHPLFPADVIFPSDYQAPVISNLDKGIITMLFQNGKYYVQSQLYYAN